MSPTHPLPPHREEVQQRREERIDGVCGCPCRGTEPAGEPQGPDVEQATDHPSETGVEHGGAGHDSVAPQLLLTSKMAEAAASRRLEPPQPPRPRPIAAAPDPATDHLHSLSSPPHRFASCPCSEDHPRHTPTASRPVAWRKPATPTLPLAVSVALANASRPRHVPGRRQRPRLSRCRQVDTAHGSKDQFKHLPGGFAQTRHTAGPPGGAATRAAVLVWTEAASGTGEGARPLTELAYTVATADSHVPLSPADRLLRAAPPPHRCAPRAHKSAQ